MAEPRAPEDSLGWQYVLRELGNRLGSLEKQANEHLNKIDLALLAIQTEAKHLRSDHDREWGSIKTFKTWLMGIVATLVAAGIIGGYVTFHANQEQVREHSRALQQLQKTNDELKEQLKGLSTSRAPYTLPMP